MLNQQSPEKRTLHQFLDVQSIFSTLQGEGPFCGTPAVFVRLAGCNLQCPGCDTDYTSKRRHMTMELIVLAVGKERTTAKPGLVVITGGEPFRQSITQLIDALIDAGYYVQVESNGTLSTDAFFTQRPDIRHGAYLVCSPKTGRVHPSIAYAACAFKYVMAADSVDPDDGLPVLALNHSARPRVARPPAHYKGPIYLQPMDSQDEATNSLNRAVCVASCLKYGYVLQLQVHKLLGLE